MKKILFFLLSFCLISLGHAQELPTPTVVDYDMMAGRPYYPNLIYPTMSQGDMYLAAIELETRFLIKVYGQTTLNKIDAAIASAVQTATTKAKTKEWQSYYLGEIIAKIQQVQNYYGSYTTTPSNVSHVLNYLGYKLSVETIGLLYWTGDDLDSVLQLLQNK